MFVCPSDERPGAVGGFLSYVANSGTPDITGVGPDTAANGLFHNLVPPTSGSIPVATAARTNDVKDGAGTTLMLSENVQKDLLE